MHLSMRLRKLASARMELVGEYVGTLVFFRLERAHEGPLGTCEGWLGQTGVDRFFILLSFAPSAAAGWHGERQRIPYAKNRARRSVFSSVGLCRRFSHQNCVRNKIACAKGGMLAPW